MPTTISLRVLLWVLLGAALVLNYQMWMRDYPPAVAVDTGARANGGGAAPLDNSAPTVTAVAETAGSSAADQTVPGNLGNAVPPVAANIASSGGTAVTGGASAAPGALNSAVPASGSVRVVTDVLDLDVSLAGGELARADLLAYPQAKNRPDLPVRLLNGDNAQDLYVVQGGLAGTAGEAAPTHLSVYSAATYELRLMPGQNEVQLPLHWSDGRGVTVTKTLTLRRGEYLIGVDYKIDNSSGMPWSFAPYAQILRNNVPIERSMFRVDSYAFKGPAIYDGQKYQKLDISKGAALDQAVRGGWIAAMQQHFVAAVVPPADASYRLQLKSQGTQFLLSATGPSQTVAAGASTTLAQTLFVGPKLQSQLERAGPRLDLVADYGKLTFLAKPLFWLLDRIHALVNNWGFTIIIVTFLLKLLFYPLSEASGRSMAKMKALSPRLANLRETYKDDREKLNRAMMEMYQREKVNPLAGCLPMLIQIPVFLAFYWVLRDSVEIRQAPFIFWISDLSSRDPFFVLPALMAIAMFVQYRLNPQVGDPVQQKVFMVMPIAMSAMFAFFPAGLVLYWVTNTVLSILQQWNINRRIEARTRARN